MKQKIINGEMHYIGYPESLCLFCEKNEDPCSFECTRDVVMCPDFKLIENGDSQL